MVSVLTTHAVSHTTARCHSAITKTTSVQSMLISKPSMQLSVVVSQWCLATLRAPTQYINMLNLITRIEASLASSSVIAFNMPVMPIKPASPWTLVCSLNSLWLTMRRCLTLIQVADSPTSMLPVPAHKKLQAKLTCLQTHNKQLAITLCGMILGWDTMFGAEGVVSVAVSAISCNVTLQS